MSANHNHTRLLHKLCEAVTLAQRGLEHRSGVLAATSMTWFNGAINAYRTALPVDPDEVEREAHPDHVDRSGAGQEQRMAARELVRAEQSPQASAEGPCDVDDLTGGQHHVRQRAQTGRCAAGHDGPTPPARPPRATESGRGGVERAARAGACGDRHRSRRPTTPPNSVRK